MVSVPKSRAHCAQSWSRRRALAALLRGGAALGAGGMALAAPPRTAVAPKFHPDGSEAHWPGNSIICHVDKRSDSFMALLDIHCALMRSGMLHRIAVLPPASYHMTIFNGVSYPARRLAFPTDVPPDASEAFCNAWLLAKLKDFDLGCELPLRLRPLPVEQQTNLYNILFEPVDAAENRKLRQLRDRLAQALSYRLPDHDSFRFHVTLNYFYSAMRGGEEQRFRQLHQRLAGDLIRRAPVLELHNPEYVYFDGMYEFRPQLLLRNRGVPG
ncbi:DUF1868 domain-containing protein [Rugamonas sp. A1-17]|nr:DUF1868 domain-containing protein [Rugamonas sp. A1-17]